MFRDRRDAGSRLSRASGLSQKEDAVILAIPKGGLEVGYEIAKNLDHRMSLIVTRKLPFPENPESGFGAVSEGGQLYLVPGMKERIPETMIERIVAEQIDEVKRRVSILRGGRPFPDIRDRTVILVDDGIAMGFTMMASVLHCKYRKPKEIIVAVPVAGPRAIERFESIVDELIVHESPHDFSAVAQVYENWYDVSDSEALNLLKKSREEGILI